MRSTRTRRLAIGVAIGALAALLPFGMNRADAATALFDFPCASNGSTTGDFDNSGTPDLAVGAPGDDLEQTVADGAPTAGVADAGSISVTYSQPGARGLDPSYVPSGNTRRFFAQNTPAVREISEKDDRFGFALAAGNFDGVGGDDLAVGAPGEDGRGGVHILYSGGRVDPASTTNLVTEGLVPGSVGNPGFNAFITQDSAGVGGSAEAGDAFGYALAAVDLNQDDIDDLIIGAPREDVGTTKDAGVIHVIYGTGHGLDPAGPSGGGTLADQVFEQGPGLVKNPEIGRTEPGDFFGAAITIGQFNGHSAADVAIGAPGEDVGRAPDAGAVSVYYSRGAFGVSRNDSDFFHQATPSIPGIPESADRFGCSLGRSDFDGDFDSDLAIGVPGEAIGSVAAAGLVHVIYNSRRATGLTPDAGTVPPANTSWTDDQMWHEGAGGVPGTMTAGDRLGASLTSGDFDGDGAGDLVIGLPMEQLFEHKQSGSVRVLYGADDVGLTGAHPAVFGQSPTDLPATCLLYGIISDIVPPLPLPECLLGPSDYSPLLLIEEEGDRFGASIAVGDFNADGKSDLSVGSPGEDLGAFVNWLTEEEATVPDELLVQLGVPVPLSLDEAPDAGAVNIVYGPFGVPNAPPARQDLLYREPTSPLSPVRGVLHTLLGSVLLADNQIHPVPADPAFSSILDGDGFGASQG